MNLLLSIIKNKYFLVSTGFLVWIVFFAEYDLISQYKQRKELKAMKEKIVYLESEIAKLQAEKHAIRTDSNTLERYAREKYFMKKANEDVFVFDSVKQENGK
ncbi:MAG: septum formation initiator family protein [Bacteroidetes bacterium]|nr:septum formation initiator family protein [Bacteroidota bacterium]